MELTYVETYFVSTYVVSENYTLGPFDSELIYVVRTITTDKTLLTSKVEKNGIIICQYVENYPYSVFKVDPEILLYFRYT